MKEKMITAKEALEISENFSNINSICEDIESSAKLGLFECTFHFISHIDMEKLKEMGYTIEDSLSCKGGYEVKW